LSSGDIGDNLDRYAAKEHFSLPYLSTGIVSLVITYFQHWTLRRTIRLQCTSLRSMVDKATALVSSATSVSNQRQTSTSKRTTV
jgi:hypothetical protein